MTTYERAVDVFSDFFPTLVKLQATILPSYDEDYWRSRWHEWVNPHSEDTKAEFERKHNLQLLWKPVWYYFHPVFCQKYRIPDRIALKTHLVTHQQLADAFLAYVQQQNLPIDEPQNSKLWYLRYQLWNDTVHQGGLATQCLWPAGWPLIQESLQQLHDARLPVVVVARPVETSQLSLFDNQP